MKKGSKEKYEILRQLLIDERIKANLKQAEVALKLSKPQSYISKIERGERSMDIVEFIEIADVIGFDPVIFLQNFYSSQKSKQALKSI